MLRKLHLLSVLFLSCTLAKISCAKTNQAWCETTLTAVAPRKIHCTAIRQMVALTVCNSYHFWRNSAWTDEHLWCYWWRWRCHRCLFFRLSSIVRSLDRRRNRHHHLRCLCSVHRRVVGAGSCSSWSLREATEPSAIHVINSTIIVTSIGSTTGM